MTLGQPNLCRAPQWKRGRCLLQSDRNSSAGEELALRLDGVNRRFRSGATLES